MTTFYRIIVKSKDSRVSLTAIIKKKNAFKDYCLTTLKLMSKTIYTGAIWAKVMS